MIHESILVKPGPQAGHDSVSSICLRVPIRKTDNPKAKERAQKQYSCVGV